MVDTVENIVDDSGVASNQSSFEASQAMLQAPPIMPGERQSKKGMWLMIGVGLLILFTTLIVLGSPKGRVVAPDSTPLPTPTPALTTSKMKEELMRLEAQVKETNPDDVLVSPPQVDMAIEF